MRKSFFAMTLCLLTFLGDASADFSFPLIATAPDATEKMTTEDFRFFAGVLEKARLAKHLECELQVKVGREARRYSQGSEWVEYLDVTYSSPIRGDLRVKFPLKYSKFGRKRSANKWSAVGEDVRIEAGDEYDHYIRFIHDGRGEIVFLHMGNHFALNPCMVRD